MHIPLRIHRTDFNYLAIYNAQIATEWERGEVVTFHRTRISSEIHFTFARAPRQLPVEVSPHQSAPKWSAHLSYWETCMIHQPSIHPNENLMKIAHHSSCSCSGVCATHIFINHRPSHRSHTHYLHTCAHLAGSECDRCDSHDYIQSAVANKNDACASGLHGNRKYVPYTIYIVCGASLQRMASFARAQTAYATLEICTTCKHTRGKRSAPMERRPSMPVDTQARTRILHLWFSAGAGTECVTLICCCCHCSHDWFDGAHVHVCVHLSSEIDKNICIRAGWLSGTNLTIYKCWAILSSYWHFNNTNLSNCPLLKI